MWARSKDPKAERRGQSGIHRSWLPSPRSTRCVYACAFNDQKKTYTDRLLEGNDDRLYPFFWMSGDPENRNLNDTSGEEPLDLTDARVKLRFVELLQSALLV
jgi:hypothetical protein